jgi:hypothetical protein
MATSRQNSMQRTGAIRSGLCKTKSRVVRVGFLVLLSILLVALGYVYQRSRFIQKANSLFDPKERVFTGTFLPWPIGRPSLFGGFDPKTDSRIRASLGYESGIMTTNGMTLIIHASDGTFFVHAN